MSPEELFARILESPDDDGPRLAYADWLESQPEAAARERGERIRLECADAAGRCDARGRARLKAISAPARRAELGRVNLWSARGFVVTCSGDLEDIARHAATIGELAPLLERLELEAPDAPSPATIQGILSNPGMARVRELSIEGGFDSGANGDEVLDVVARSQLPSLRRLEMRHMTLGTEALSNLLRAPIAGHLEGLSLDLARIGPEGVAMLADEPDLHWRSLGLAGCGVGSDGMDALAGSGWVPELVALDLGANDLDDLETLLSIAFVRLSRLDLGSNPLGSTGARSLAGSPRLASLRDLRLANVGLSDGGARALATGHFPMLHSLEMAGNDMGPGGAGSLLGAPWVGSLRHLDLSENQIDDAVAAAIANGPPLVTLQLRGDQIGDEGAIALAASVGLASLQLLDLTDNPIGERGARALLDSPHLRDDRLALSISGAELLAGTRDRIVARFGRSSVSDH